MTWKVLPALAWSDHGARVRFAGGGFIPSCRKPFPVASVPWQIAQLAPKMTLPACCASDEDNTPAGAAGVPLSHPEMASKTVNRAMLSCNVCMWDNWIAKTFNLANNGRDKGIQSPVNSF